MRSIFAFLFCIGIVFSADAQIKKFALKDMERLCAPDMHGRGYVSGGDSIAAEYIAAQLKNAGAKPVGGSYFQEFSFGVNTFPGKMELSVDGKALVAGEHFIIEPNAGGGKGSRKAHFITPKDAEGNEWLKLLGDEEFVSGSIIVLDPSGLEDKKAIRDFLSLQYPLAKKMPVIVLQENDLVWAVGKAELAHPIFTVKAEDFPTDPGTISYNVDQQFVTSHKTRNVIGMIKGKHKKKKKQYVLFVGHYDHLGRMGSENYFPGANDNASGISMILSMARHYQQNPPDYSIVFIAFAGEEAGLLGSEYFADHPLVKMKKIRFVLNLDILGTGDDGITVVNGTIYEEEFALMQKINNEKDYLAKVKVRGETQNSDHYHFHRNGVPAVFIYTMGGIGHYHNIFDKSETLPLTEFEDLHHLLRDFVDAL